MGKYTVAYGNPFDGLTFYGVFDDFDTAEEYAAAHGDLNYWLVELQEIED